MISSSELAARRAALMQSMSEDGIALIPAASETLRNRDVHHPFRQDSDFLYLTGFNEPDALAVLAPGHALEFMLFVRPRDPEREVWDGRRAGPEGAMADYAADKAWDLDQLDELLPEILGRRSVVYYNLGQRDDWDDQLSEWMNALRGRARHGLAAPTRIESLEPLLHEQRLIKSESEQNMMRRAGEISAAAHCRAMQFCQPGQYEYQLAAEIQHEFDRNGMTWAYGSIVGSGENACILHYIENTAQMRDGDLVLIDAGAEYHGYCGDITRTFPVSGRFSAAQKAVYQVVLNAQLAAIDKARVGQRWNDPHDAAVQVLTAGLVELGLLQGDVDALIEKEAYRRFYMHNTGHWLGMDVHDVGAYKLQGEWRELKTGMVMTVEPGLYIAAADDIDERFHNIGIRIEDDVLVTDGEPEVLTSAVPKTVVEIESLMAS